MKKISLLILFSILFCSANSYGQTDKLKVVFIYNFSKYIQWPSESSSGNFEIGVIGETSVINELKNIAKTRKVGSQPIEIKLLASSDEIGDEHILYLPMGTSSQLSDVAQKTSNSPTLIITEKQGLANQGSGINFLIDEGKLLFEINKTSIESHTLKVSSQLLNLGKKVQ